MLLLMVVNVIAILLVFYLIITKLVIPLWQGKSIITPKEKKSDLRKKVEVAKEEVEQLQDDTVQLGELSKLTRQKVNLKDKMVKLKEHSETGNE